jgi:hypothetical protein
MPVSPSATDPFKRLVEHWRNREIGWRPVLSLLPSGSGNESGGDPPIFALIARAHDRTLISLTQPGVRLDAEQKLVLQRFVISDLVRGRRLSLTVYEDHALGASALRLVGVGGRVTFRPSVTLGGWRFRLELLATYNPGAGSSAYLALSGRLPPPPAVQVPTTRNARR